MGRRFKSLFFVFLLVFGVILSSSNVVLATTCLPTPDPWFDIEIFIDESTLPVGVTFEKNYKYPQYNKRYFFENIVDTPLYIVMGQVDMGPVIFLSAPDSLTNLPFRVDLGKIYWIFRVQKGVNYYHHRWWSEGEGYRGEWKTDRPGTSIYSKAFIDVRDLEAIGIKTQLVSGDNRPADIEIPHAQDFVFRVYHGNSPVEIHGKFVYSLNKDYNPKAGEEGLAKCLGQSQSSILALIGTLIIPAILILGWPLFIILRNPLGRYLTMSLILALIINLGFFIYIGVMSGFLVWSQEEILVLSIIGWSTLLVIILEAIFLIFRIGKRLFHRAQ